MSSIWDEFFENYHRRQHGRDRRASKASKGGSASEPDSGPRGAKAQRADKRASRPFQAKAAGQGTGVDPQWFYETIYLYSRPRSGKWAPPWMSGELAVPNAAKTWTPRQVDHIKSEGVIAGEIVAWRAWHWNGQKLRSIFVDYEWPTDGPAIGEPGNGYGIHAFKTPQRAVMEYIGCINDVIIGQVALWGDVIEFEAGYTAEFAKVLTLDGNAPPEVYELYGVKK